MALPDSQGFCLAWDPRAAVALASPAVTPFKPASRDELLLPEIELQQEFSKEVVFRADAAFAKPETSVTLEERGVKYAIRTSANDTLELDIGELLTCPIGRSNHKPVV